jgi:urease accessory protein
MCRGKRRRDRRSLDDRACGCCALDAFCRIWGSATDTVVRAFCTTDSTGMVALPQFDPLIRFIRATAAAIPADVTLTLTLEQRTRCRLRVMLDDGREAGLFLPRGSVLHHGDALIAEDGLVARIIAAPEHLSRVDSPDPLLLARACYHLGNRHVPLQIEPGRLSYRQDQVLDDLVRGLGLNVTLVDAAFEPETGAYGDHGADQPLHAHDA